MISVKTTDCNVQRNFTKSHDLTVKRICPTGSSNLSWNKKNTSLSSLYTSLLNLSVPDSRSLTTGNAGAIFERLIPARISIQVNKNTQKYRKVKGHVPLNRIHITTGSNVKSKITSCLVTNACHITNRIDELMGIIEITSVLL